MFFLTLRRDEVDLLRIPVTAELTTVGSGESCDVQLPDPAIAPQHFGVEVDAGQPVLINFAPAGTVVNGTTVEWELRLTDGDAVHLGPYRAVFSGPPEADAPAEPRSAPGVIRTLARPRKNMLGDDLDIQLRVRRFGQPDRVFPWPPGELFVGRDPSNRLVLEDPLVSAREARLVRGYGQLLVEKTDSRNGVWLDGVRINSAIAEVGSIIHVGETELVVEAASREQPELMRGVVGESAAMQEVRKVVRHLGPWGGAVIIMGETGTGKESIARAIHDASPRKDGAFVIMDCAGLSSTLMESELYGHEKGAFTGADRARAGAFEDAAGGTIFLDEVGELTLEQQPKLLRVLQEGTVKRVGGNTFVQVDVRVVCATHRDLQQRVNDGLFREDLYRRLNGFELELPPLRLRGDDRWLIIEQHLRKRAVGPRPLQLGQAAHDLIAAYPFPGNVRELLKALDRGMLFPDGDEIGTKYLQLKLPAAGAAPVISGKSLDLEAGKLMRHYHARIARWTLELYGDERQAAATALGIDRKTLRKYLEDDEA